MAEAYRPEQVKFVNVGLYLRRPRDLMPLGTYVVLTNWMSIKEGALSPRVGTAKILPAYGATGNQLDELNVHSLGYLNGTYPELYAGAGTSIYEVYTGYKGPTGLSGNPLTFVPYRPNLMSAPSMVVGDINAMYLIFGSPPASIAGIVSAVALGIPPPTVAETSTNQPSQQTNIDAFSADTYGYNAHIATHTVASSFTNGVVPITTDALQVVLDSSGLAAYIQKVVNLNLAEVGSLVSDDQDYINIWINVDQVSKIAGIELLFDVDPATVSGGSFTASAFQTAYYYANILPSAFQVAQTATSVQGLQAQINAIQQQLQNLQSFPTYMGQESGLYQMLQQQLQQLEAQLSALQTGNLQWVRFQILKSSFVLVQGSNTSYDWSNVVGWRIVITPNPTAASPPTVTFDAWYLFGGEGPDSSVAGAVGYDWLYTYYDPITGSEGNPSPAQADAPPTGQGQQVIRVPVLLQPTFTSNPRIGGIYHYRRGGSLGENYQRLGSQANCVIPAVTSISRDGSGRCIITCNAQVPSTFTGQTIFIQNMTDTSFNGVWPGASAPYTSPGPPPVIHWNEIFVPMAGAAGSTSGGTVTIVFLDTFTDTAIASATTLVETNDQPVTTVNISGQAVYAQPLPYIFGPYQGNVIFGVGDPNRPGFLYWCNPGNPDGWASYNNVEVTQPSDPLQNGFMYGVTPYVFSKKTLQQVFPSLSGVPNSFQAIPTACSKGLAWSPYAFCVGPAIWFLAEDAIYETTGGPETPITEDDLWPIFHGLAAENYQPIDFTQTNFLRMAYRDNEVFFMYKDRTGNIQVIVYHRLRRRWRHANYYYGPYCLYADAELGNVLLLGGGDGWTRAEVPASTADDGQAVTYKVRSGAYDQGVALRAKEYGHFILDADPQAALLSVSLLYNDEQISAGAYKFSGSGRQPFPQSLGDQYALNVMVDVTTTTTAAPVLYGFEINYRLDRLAMVHMEVPEDSLGVDGWKHVYDGYIVIRSQAPVTLSMIGDGVALPLVTIPSTNMAKQRLYLQFGINKFKVLRRSLDSSLPFQVYAEDSYMTVAGWNDGMYRKVPIVANVQ